MLYFYDPFYGRYIDYEDIPLLTREYIMTVAGVQEIGEIPIADINGFLLMLEADLTIESATAKM